MVRSAPERVALQLKRLWKSAKSAKARCRLGIHVARAPFDRVADTSTWTYFAGFGAGGSERWSSSSGDTHALDGQDVTRFFDKNYIMTQSCSEQGPNMDNEFSVTRFQNCGNVSTCYVMIGQLAEPYSSKIVARWSRSPLGPWSAPIDVYPTPESSSALMTYNSHAHGWTLSGHTISISYNVNRVQGAPQKSSEYRPRFIRATLDW